MPTLTIGFEVPNPAPAEGFIVKYRIKNSDDDYIEIHTPTSPVTISNLAFNTEYEGTVESDCGTHEVIEFKTCSCTSPFVANDNMEWCEDVNEQPASVTHSDYCLAPSRNPVYGTFFTRIYKPGFSNEWFAEHTLPPSQYYAQMTTSGQWRNSTTGVGTDWSYNSATATYNYTGNTPFNIGPVNRSSVWIDSDCNGLKNPLAVGTQTTIAFNFVNTGDQRTIHVGIAADNEFTLIVNGVEVARTVVQGTDRSFKILHIVPVILLQGNNYFNVVAVGDGSNNDAVAMIVYDNVAEEIKNAISNTDLRIVFDTANLIGQHIDIATCPENYSLDTSKGAGNYTCIKNVRIHCQGIIG